MAQKQIAIEAIKRAENIRRIVKNTIKGSVLEKIADFASVEMYDPAYGFVVYQGVLDRSEYGTILDGIAKALEAIGSAICEEHNCLYHVAVVDATNTYRIYLYIDF